MLHQTAFSPIGVDNMSTVEDPKPDPITERLRQMRGGSPAGRNDLLDLVYTELRRLASSHFRRERAGHTLQTTALVHEAYIRMSDQFDQSWSNRCQFFALATKVIRQILVDHARKHRARKRGDGQQHVNLDEAFLPERVRLDDVVLIDTALQRLAAWDERASRVVEMRFFAGLSESEIAEVLGISLRTVKRDWTAARAWLQGELKA